MTKEELKKVLKPLIKECIKDVFFEPGVLSSVIKEVVGGMVGTTSSVETKSTTSPSTSKEEVVKKIEETKRKMLESINRDAYGGVDLFEGTSPIASVGVPSSPSEPEGMSAATNPLSNVDPNDPGVDISFLKRFKK
jgi:hypothetical protein